MSDRRTATTPTVSVRIVADTRPFRRELLKAQLLFTQRWWRRLPLRLRLWRVNREGDPSA